MLDVSNKILIIKTVWYSNDNDLNRPNIFIEINMFYEPDTKKYIGHLIASIDSSTCADIQVIDSSYLSLCYQIHKKCFRVINKYYFKEIKSEIEANQMRNMLECTNKQLTNEYNKQLQTHQICKSIVFDTNSQQLIFNSDEIARSLIHSGYIYTLHVKSFPNPDDRSIIDTYGIYSSYVGNGILYYICHFNNVTFDVTIKERLVYSNIDGLNRVSPDNWLYDGIINKDYHKDVVYRYICKVITGPIDPYYFNPDYDSSRITFEGINYVLSIPSGYIRFADIVDPSLMCARYNKLFDSISPFFILNISQSRPNYKEFTNALAKKLEEVRTYDHYPLIMISRMLQKIEMDKSKFS